MASAIFTIIANIQDFDKLEVMEENLRKKNAVTSAVEQVLRAKYAELGRTLVSKKTGLDFDNLSAAEEKIVEAVAKYVGLQKRAGKPAGRTLQMIANRGLIEAAEVAVSKSKPTQGFEVLEAADLAELSFERIILDHPEEFSPRSLWYSRRTLGLANDSERPPVSAALITQIRTEQLIEWLRQRAATNEGHLKGYTNADAGAALGFDDLSTHGRVLGNITSRIDFACYKCRLPPIGLVAEKSFPNAWRQEDRGWSFPVAEMARAAQERRWSEADLDRILAASLELPGTASIPWKKELRENERSIRDWAFGLGENEDTERTAAEPDSVSDELSKMAELERRALRETPKGKLKIARTIERGPISNAVKKANGYKCQLCEALGTDLHSFLKRNGTPYVEAHHVTPVSEMEIGSLSASNIMTLCANHHRQMHYGNVAVEIGEKTFQVTIDGELISVHRLAPFG